LVFKLRFTESAVHCSRSSGHTIKLSYVAFWRQLVQIECVQGKRYGKLKGGQNQLLQSVHLKSSMWNIIFIFVNIFVYVVRNNNKILWYDIIEKTNAKILCAKNMWLCLFDNENKEHIKSLVSLILLFIHFSPFLTSLSDKLTLYLIICPIVLHAKYVAQTPMPIAKQNVPFSKNKQISKFKHRRQIIVIMYLMSVSDSKW